MNREFRIGMLWVEGPLGYVEQLCAKSFVDAGHIVELFHYGEISNVPEGITCTHGSEILDISSFIQHGRTNSLALFSDVFRYHLLSQRDHMIWADLDAYCARPFQSETGHFFGWESKQHINGGVLGLPKDSDALGQLLEMTEDEYGIPEWIDGEERARLEGLAEAGAPLHVSEYRWGVWGPHAVTYFLQKTGESRYALPMAGLYPIHFRNRRWLVRSGARARVDAALKPDTYSVHFYGRRIRDFLARRGGLPEPGSYMAGLLEKHRIESSHNSLVSDSKIAKAPARVVSTAPRSRTGLGGPNLTDLADRYGSDKGSAKHRYTELYHMLFHPYRQRKINILEMGLQIGGPEMGMDKDRPTTDCPSVRMWLEYFPKASVHGLDVSDFSWFSHERFTFHQCDMDSRSEIAAVFEKGVPVFDVVMDDASHASHHQQNAFLEIFPRLKSGGLYVIEDLRWQPAAYEKPGITKTAALFRSWLDHREFRHSDPEVAAAFNDVSDDISGCIIEPVRFQKHRKDQIVVIHKK